MRMVGGVQSRFPQFNTISENEQFDNLLLIVL